mgnify:CR=1 FL=1
MPRQQSIQYEMKKQALEGITDRDTQKLYKKGIDRFKGYMSEIGLKASEVRADRVAAVQSFERHLENEGKSPHTIHAYIAPVCKGLGIKMSEIDKPERTARSITKGRVEANAQGRREADLEKNNRLVSFQKVVGIRRSELADLKPSDICRTASGDVYVHVRHGKGGKEQYQYVLPMDRDAVLSILNGSQSNSRLFSDKELNNKIDMHSMRAIQAQRAYGYYADRIQAEPSFKVECIKKMLAYFDRMNVHDKQYDARLKAFKADILNDNLTYRLRGDNAQKARELGLPLVYDRVALSMVSVFHLAHWRNDVTVKDYMVR